MLEIYSSITSLFPSNTTLPLLRFTSIPSLMHHQPNARKFTSLSAGDSHFSFIVNHHWTSSSISIAESYYNKVWSIRTDKRSLNEVAWIPLEEELRGLEEDLFFWVEGSDIVSTTLHGKRSDENGGFGEGAVEMQRDEDPDPEGGKDVQLKTEKLGLFCAEDSDSRDTDFTISKSNGWITLGLTTEIPSNSSQHLTHPSIPPSPPPGLGKAYLLPFSRARSTIPALPTSEIAFKNILDIHCGSEHVLVLLSNGEVWSLGNHSFGQRGLQSSEEEVLLGWIKVSGMGMGRVKKIFCGKWNSFFIVERS